MTVLWGERRQQLLGNMFSVVAGRKRRAGFSARFAADVDAAVAHPVDAFEDAVADLGADHGLGAGALLAQADDGQGGHGGEQRAGGEGLDVDQLR
jgi:hypothetical protein